MSRFSRAFPVFLLSFLVPAVAGARSVFLNTQNIDSVRSQTFENVTVLIDASGNVVIKSDAYKIEKPVEVPAAGLPETKPETFANIPRGVRYWLVSEENAPGMSQYEFDVFVNGQLAKTVKSGEGQVVEDVSKWVVAGAQNTVTITARKVFGAARKSESKDMFLRVYVGRGALNESGAIVIEHPEVDYRRTAAEVQNFADQLTFTPK